MESLAEIPPGEYYVQAFFNKYTKFERADGHVVWMHNDQWEGQSWKRSPGNIYSEVKKVYIDPDSTDKVELVVTKVISDREVPEDTDYVKRIKIKSETLSEFWGRPIYIGATILQPRDFDKKDWMY